MPGAVVGVLLEVFAKIGRPEAAQAAGAKAGRRHQGDDDGVGTAESVKKGVLVQEKRRRSSGVLSDSETMACMLMDRFAPA
ncbi:hypothetical protein BAE44_0008700 [Dichanthelium oligosanthes]|uniref:Uncharacterized protein n=1 Tax=Dichanthelium oligosanthes TaxID=888268 RepID=A0A1E5VYU1_9POAL|nr:hypothetical protein BAE44_0008700 [Dichanthelium oligosanthes]